MPSIALSTPLQSRIGPAQVDAAGETVGQVLRALEADQPALRGWLLDDQGSLREHVNVFLKGSSVGLDQPLDEEDEVFIIQAISGGCHAR